MDKFVIEGGTPLNGEIATSGAKNSALPALAAALLTDEKVVLHRIPRVDELECVGCNLCALLCPVDCCITMYRLDT